VLGTPLVHKEDAFKKTTPRVVLTYKASEAANFYASYSQGFRSGTEQFPNVVAATNLPPVSPDTLTNYEIGSKGRLFGGMVDYEAALYYISWKDVQISTTVLIGPLPFTALINGPKATGPGTDLSLTIHPTSGLDVGGTFSVNGLKIDDTITSAGTVLFEKGDRLNNSPTYTTGGFLNYLTDIGSAGYKLRFNASVNHTSPLRYSLVLAAKEVGVGDPMTFARASVALDSPSRWNASLFVDNLNNEHGVVLFPFGVPEYKSRVRPRTVGLQFEYKM
jgi:iron complex outermembrane receptor protein